VTLSLILEVNRATTHTPQKDLERLKLSLHMLRNVLHSTLPVELYHFTEEFTDASLREELSNEYGITFRAVDGRRPNGKSWSECTRQRSSGAAARQRVGDLAMLTERQISRTSRSWPATSPSSCTWTA
jgi:hypothetical protein